MFLEMADPARLENTLLPLDAFHPYPKAAERAAWEGLPATERGFWIETAATTLDQPWPELSATLFLEFARNGNRTNYEGPYFQRRSHLLALALGECAEGKGRFLDALANALWSLCEESSWCMPAHIGMQQSGCGLPDTTEPTVDLFAGETGALVSWIHYLLAPELARISPLIPERLRREVQHLTIQPAWERENWWWQGFCGQNVNNWNPWINANLLTCLLLLEPEPAFRAGFVSKILKSLEKFAGPYPSDGGCDEGPAYWSRAAGSLFDALDILEMATAGKLTFWHEPLIGEMGRFVCRAHLAGNWFVNFADAPARLHPEGAVLYAYGQKIGDADLMALGAWARGEPCEHRRRHSSSAGRILRDLFSTRKMMTVPATPPLRRDHWLPVIEVLVSRTTEGSSQGLTLVAKGGHNDESHNHNDVGNFLVYTDGHPLLVDVGVETYQRDTFSNQRYNIWTMVSGYHNLPTVNGLGQLPGRDFQARNVACRIDDLAAVFEVDIAPAYAPESGLEAWHRRLTLFRRDGTVILEDSYRCRQAPREVFLSLMTPSDPQLHAGEIVLETRELPDGERSGDGRICFDPALLHAECETITLTDPLLRKIWGDRLSRLKLRVQNPAAVGSYTLDITPCGARRLNGDPH